MSKKSMSFVVVILVIVSLSLSAWLPGAAFAAGNGNGTGSGSNGGGGLVLGPLSKAEADALVQALKEEYGAQALYQSVLSIFGDVAPFNNIVLSEGQHISVLTKMAVKYGVTVPAYTPGPMPTFTRLSQACQAGAVAEINDAALYDTLISVTKHADLLRVYSNLQSVSLNQHLPAFEACQ